MPLLNTELEELFMKILFTDLDGTLLNDEKQIPEVNSAAVNKPFQKEMLW